MDPKTKAHLEKFIGKEIQVQDRSSDTFTLKEVTEDALIVEREYEDNNVKIHKILEVLPFQSQPLIGLSLDQLEKDLNPEENEADECSVCPDPGKECEECSELYCSNHMDDPDEHGCVPECYIDCGKSGDAVTLCAECENHYCKKHMKDPNEHGCATGEEETVDAEASTTPTTPGKIMTTAGRKKEVPPKESPFKDFPWVFVIVVGFAIALAIAFISGWI